MRKLTIFVAVLALSSCTFSLLTPAVMAAINIAWVLEGNPDTAQRALGGIDVGPLVAAVEGGSAYDVFGSPDDLKVRSSMTLFAEATDDDADFTAVLGKYYGGEPDPRTLELL